MILSLFLLIFAPFSFAAQPAETSAPSYGILILAHGAGKEWDSQVSGIRRAVNARVPAEVAFGMAAPDAMQAAVDRLEARGVKRIAVVPLFINSHSSVMDQTRYALRLSSAPSRVFIQAMKKLPSAILYMAGMDFDPHKRVVLRAKIVMTRALDDDPLVADILIDRAKELSRRAATSFPCAARHCLPPGSRRRPSKETVILVGHGPVDNAENKMWLATMRGLCRKIRAAGGYKAAWAATIRDDAPPPVKAKADAILRDMVRRADENGGRALVVPELVARGGVETHIVGILRGLPYAWDDKTLAPDPRLALWVLKRARRAFARR
ncbi:MAG TPA: CbiX/SirB N-terminal domain-containing protein [Elusimicrobiota bacterium]|nr:CbiX/SirB N-terminal domain-containing protein [Elusimicrobiota bacterium]